MATNPTIPAELLTLISRIYDASLNTQEWPCVVESIAALYESDKALLMTPGQLPQDGGLIFPVGITATALQQWESHYAPHDVWVRVSLERNLFQEGAVVTDEDLFPFDELLLTIWYQEFLSQIGIARLLSGVILGSSPNRGAPCILSVFRGREDLPFSLAHRSLLELLIPHLSRSLGIMLRLRCAEMQVASSRAALDTIRSGIILIGEQGQVVHANHTAQAIFHKGDGLSCKRDNSGLLKLCVTDLLEQQTLVTALSACLNPRTLRVAHFSQCVKVSRKAKDQPYALQLSAFPPDRQFGQGTDQACAIVFVNDPEQPPCVDNQTLRQLFGLTDAECRVAIALCTGETLVEIAESLGVRESTIKTHLLKIFEKTNTHRRVHLVKLLLALSSHNQA